jgi:predicted MFS family arabinose efflux permease
VLLTILFFAIVRDPTVSVDDAPPVKGHVFTGILRELGRCFTNVNVVLSAVFAGAAFGTMLAVGTLWGPRIMEARGASTDFATLLTALAWLGLAVGAPLINIVSDRWHSRKVPAVIWLILQTAAITLVIYLPVESNGAAVVLMFAVGLFSGVQMLGFTVAGESIAGSLIGSASAIVNGFCFLIGGLLTSIPSILLPADAALADYQAALWLMPLTLVIGVVAAALLRPKTPAKAAIASAEA